VQTAIEGTRTAAEGTTAAGWIANDLAGAGGFAPDAPASGGGGSDLPEPPRLSPATVGERFENRSNPAQVAHQTEPDGFTVTDSVQGTISHHKGNIYAPYAAQAAFIRIPRRRGRDRRRCQQPNPQRNSPPSPHHEQPGRRQVLDGPALLFAGMAAASPYFTAMAMRARGRSSSDPGGLTMRRSSAEEAGGCTPIARPPARALAAQPGRGCLPIF
jgi:hypothetical protein